uniref:Peptidase S9 prolyl oligopeptidase catalytic domain-containing protein n=1 Tax=Arcella intermedia TaxID=1963864 RepID=A0A6B2KYV8_9EUKA
MYLTYASQPLTVKTITTDGSFDIEYGLMPWVYEEEVFSDYNAIWWKPKGTALPDQFLFFKSDSSMVRTFQYPIYNDDVEKDAYNTIDSIKYPKSGSNNSKVYLSLYNIQNGNFLPLPLDSTDEYITDVAWPYEDQIVVRTSNRLQTVETVHIFSVSSTNVHKVTQFITQSVENGWIVPRPYSLFFFNPSTFTMVHNNSDYYHIFLVTFTNTSYSFDDVTSGSFDVTDVVGFSAKNALIFFLSTENGPNADPTSRHLYMASILTKGRKKLNPDDKAYYSTTFNDDGSYFVCNYQGPQIPNTAIYQSPTRIDQPTNWNATLVKVLEDNQALKDLLATYTLPTRTYINVTSADPNTTLSAWYMFPPVLNTSNYYPLLLDIYCGPNSQTVTQQWELGFDEYLVSRYPVVVASIDTRGTGARGISFMQQVYRQLGILESADLLAGIKSLSTQNLKFGEHIDAGRMGIWGWSYGGFMSLNTLARDTKNQLIAAVSVAPVTDWRLYDTFYTERYMSTPQDNPQGYNTTSILNLAPQLLNNSKPLLVVHGTGDDNVHFQNSALLNKKLFEIGYQYEMLYYANKQHGISGNAARRHLYTAISKFLNQNLFSLPATMELATNN